MQYRHGEIEAKWQKYWEENQTFRAENNSSKPKYYVLDMFPYPSGAGLHVGHPLGYIASDILSRYKRLKGFNVLHPMGYDSFGLPAEQYAIQTGQHPALTTEVNIKGGKDKQGNTIEGYEKQMKKIGLSFDWAREFRTSDPNYYKWTQWIFMQLFDAWYDNEEDKARTIDELVEIFEKEGNGKVNAACDEDTPEFSAEEWNSFSEKKQQEILLKYRLTYLAEAEVNWCPGLGTVLANDEVVNGLSERGGFPVIRKKMTQWMMRITAYAERLLNDLEKLDWPGPIKDAQTYWIGKSHGASVHFKVKGHDDTISVFTTRPDTLYGVSYLALAPEHPLVEKIVTEDRKEEVMYYVDQASRRSERERMADVDKITGIFTGAEAIHPLTGKEIPIWVGDYVLSSYGTGALMAVPAGDDRDYRFARFFDLPIINIFKDVDVSVEPFMDKGGFELMNSGIIDGMDYEEATKTIISELEKNGIGEGMINYRLRDAVFSRQRYWGEPVPAYFKDGVPYMLPESALPLILPEVDEYLPTETGEPPLGRAKNWAWDTEQEKVVSNELIDHENVFPLELNTMPGWAGSSWYFLRYMSPHCPDRFASKESLEYWKDVDLYMGGSEHATGHLLYSRFWQKFLFDLGLVPEDEYAKKLINQGMIQGMSAFVNRLHISENRRRETEDGEGSETGKPIFISKKWADRYLEIASQCKPNNRVILYDTTIFYPKEIAEILTDEDRSFFEQVQKMIYSDRPAEERKGRGRVMEPVKIHADISLLKEGDELDTAAFKNWREENAEAEFILEDEKFITEREVEKMSKSKYNVVNPDQICEEYGADTLRLYEMFLGPIEQSKPWNTQGLSGVYSFLKKLWKLYHSGENESFYLSDEEPGKAEMKVLHQMIQKVDEDIQEFSFNTSVSHFMIAVNELTKLGCHKRQILEPLAVLLSPYAPHISEELWEKAGHKESISFTEFPEFDAKWLVEDSKEYPVSFNGKTRFTLELPMDYSKEKIEEEVMKHEKTQFYLQGKTPKKVIVVPGRIINIVF